MKTLLLMLVLPIGLQAGVIYVDNDNATTPNGGNQYPFSSIQVAITNAAENDTIKIAKGTYTRIDNMGKSLILLGGYQGGTPTAYSNGSGGDFVNRTMDASLTHINGGGDSIGVNITRFDFNPFKFVFDNFTVKNCTKGIVCDTEVSWPHAENVTISNSIIEDNGQPGITTLGAGLLVAGLNHKILNNIIRNNHGGRGAGISRSGTPDSLLIEGNLIENNTGYDDHAAGIYLDGYVTLTNNIISGNYLQNTYGWGGGVLILGTAHMSFNTIKDNFCPSYGGGVFVDEGGIAYMDNELIYHNRCDYTGAGGAGVALDNGAPGSSYVYMTNCTVVNNYSPGTLGGNAIFADVSSFCTVKNCIMAGNGDDFYANNGSDITVTYTLNQEAYVGQGNITGDPLFADSLNEDFHLKSKGGRYNPTNQNWVIDNIHSPAIDTGDPTSSYSNEPAPNGNRINLGCYGNTIYASKSFTTSNEEGLIDVQIIAYPNPTSSSFQLKLDNSQFTKGEIIIYNTLGEKVFQSEILNPKAEINTNLSKGIYFYQILNQKQLIGNGKLMIQ